MLSKKMAFSLMSLITILALAASPVMADEFSAAIGVNDVSFADGEQTVYGRQSVAVTFGQPVALAANTVAADSVTGEITVTEATSGTMFGTDDVVIRVLNMYGRQLGVVPVTAPDTSEHNFANLVGNKAISPGRDGKTFTLTFEVYSRYSDEETRSQGNSGSNASRDNEPMQVHISIAKNAVEAADPTFEIKADGTRDVGGKSAAAAITLDFVHDDGQGEGHISPKVLGIEREGNLDIVGVRGAFRIIVTLSEEPKEGKFELDVTNGKATLTEALEPKPQDIQFRVIEGPGVGAVDAFDSAGRALYQFMGNVYPAASATDAAATNVSADDLLVSTNPLVVLTMDDPADTDPSDGTDQIAVTSSTTGVVRFQIVPRNIFDVRPGVERSGFSTPATGRDSMHYPYLVTITPNLVNGDDIVIKVKEFEDQVKPLPNPYRPKTRAVDEIEGVDKLTVRVLASAVTPAAALDAGHEVLLTNKRRIPAGGFLIVATDPALTGINLPANADADDNTPKSSERSPLELKYNVIKVGLPNLEAFLTNGGTIDLVSPNAGLVISEIMWGSDASLDTNSHSQWIEIKNTTAAEIATGDKTHKLIFYGPGELPPAKTAAVAATATTAAMPAALPAGVVDRVGTITDTGVYWQIIGKGRSGRTGFGEEAADLTALVATLELKSMYRVMVADTAVGAAVGAMKPEDGTMPSSWMESTGPSANQDPAKGGNRISSPGRDRIITAAEAAAELAEAEADAIAAAEAADTSVSMPMVGQIYISEIMFAGGGILPQWIEISNGSRTEEVNLSDWTITVDNAVADADVSVGASIRFTIPEGTKINPHEQHNPGGGNTPSTILVVTERGRNNFTGAKSSGQVLNLWDTQQTELILAGVTRSRYSLLSDMAFQITLAPPVPIVVPPAKTAPRTTAAEIAAARTAAATKKAADAKAALERKRATDVVGNLSADGAAAWALPMDEGARSSILRRHVSISIGPTAPEAGAMMDSWVLASDTSFAQVTHIRASSYYGAANDVGTPGFRAGGALPVELSHFRPARNKETGAVVITWSTQSELNNAGFFIKRSQQPNGEFKIINATMIPGAGTSSEKQSYTYEDTTAQPNVVYYYQIEDVSLDGNRQTLTRGIRLKGHVSVAGKATLTWGELKTSQ